MGFAVHMGTLSLLEMGIGMDYYPASILAVEAAILHNFIWHGRWTWADRRRTSRNPIIVRFLYFHLANGMTSLSGILLLVPIFVDTVSFDSRLANILSIAICSVINFFAGDRFVFRCSHTQMNSGD